MAVYPSAERLSISIFKIASENWISIIRHWRINMEFPSSKSFLNFDKLKFLFKLLGKFVLAALIWSSEVCDYALHPTGQQELSQTNRNFLF